MLKKTTKLLTKLVDWAQLTLKLVVRWALVELMSLIVKHTEVKKLLLKILIQFPQLKNKLRKLAITRGLIKVPRYNPQQLVLKKDAEVSCPTQSRVIDIDYFDLNISQKTSEIYRLNFDFDLISVIRKDHGLKYELYSFEQLGKIVTHIYLALLYRFPSAQNIYCYEQVIFNDKSFEALFRDILNSPEFKIRGHKNIIQ